MGQRATIVGAGLIGGSVGMALRDEGWAVAAVDRDGAVAERAVSVGAADTVGFDDASDLVVVASPVGVVVDLVEEALDRCGAVVTDVGSTKAEICGRIEHARFVG